jgi:transposase
LALGPPPPRLARQLASTPSETFPGRGRLAPPAQRLRDLEKKLHDVTQERDILKTALAYFADDQK